MIVEFVTIVGTLWALYPKTCLLAISGATVASAAIVGKIIFLLTKKSGRSCKSHVQELLASPGNALGYGESDHADGASAGLSGFFKGQPQ